MADNVTRSGAPRLADVARELGVSQTTVSRALSGKGRLSEDTRRRVLEGIAATGYRPNMLARGLAQSRTYNLCALLPSDAFVSQAPFFQDCLMGICQTASAADYDVIVAADTEGDVTQLLRVLSSYKADGYIIMRSISGDPAAPLLRERGYPFVIIGRPEDESLPHVDANNADACRQLTETVLRGGLSRPALLLGDGRHLVNRSRAEGFFAAAALFPDASVRAYTGLTDPEEIKKAARRAVDCGADCVFCGDDYIGSVALPELKRDAPELRVCHFYSSGLLGLDAENAAVPDTDARSLGRAAAELLMQELNAI